MSKDKKEIENKYTWTPSLKWMLKTLGIIYVVIIIVFFSLNFLLKPYMRDIPMELTPWLDKTVSVSEQK